MNQQTVSTTGESSKHSPFLKKRVLVVDDHLPTRKMLGDVLQEWSYAPSLAADFREARNAVLTEDPFTVIVSDYHLPDGTGLELRDWLNREMLLDVPFLLISGGLSRTPATADDYEFLAKPFTLQEFRDRLEKLSRVNRQPADSFSLSAAQEAMASVYARSKPQPGK